MVHNKNTSYGLKVKDIRSMKNVLKLYPKVSKAIIYGSRAKGNYRNSSDIDLALYGDSLSYTDLIAIDNALDDLLLPYTIDLCIYNLIENPELIDHINRIGKELYISSSAAMS